MKKDFYTQKARREGYLARSVYKLKELNEKYSMIKRTDNVLDLGCFPGGWVQYCLEMGCNVTGIDVKQINIKNKNFNFHKVDVFEIKTNDFEKKFDVVLSDMAPGTTGIKDLDRGRSSRLALKALEVATILLKHNGNFLAKIFQSDELIMFINECKKNFYFVKCDKPKASKSKSVEMYVVCKGFKFGRL